MHNNRLRRIDSVAIWINRDKKVTKDMQSYKRLNLFLKVNYIKNFK